MILSHVMWQLPFPMNCLYVDPDRKAYDVMGLYYGLGRTFFNPASAKVSCNRFSSLLPNTCLHRAPNFKVMGGIFVFKRKQLLYARKDEGTADHAPLEDILKICCTSPVV